VPNLLNLPFLLWGLGGPRELVGLAMYAASRTAGCAYCSAHSCTFALRRGTPLNAIARAVDDDLSRHSPEERAAIAVARAIARVPPEPASVAAERKALEAALPEGDAESVVLAVAMMGFLNKFLDALGVELEEPTVAEVQRVVGPSGWTPGKHLDWEVPAAPPPPPDSLATMLGVFRHAPSAVVLDKKWTAGVPDRWPDVGTYLRAHTGHDFPVLGPQA